MPRPLDEARRVHAQHESITARIRSLGARLAAPSRRADHGASRPEIAGSLRDLARDLSGHFRDEEQVGFVRYASEAAPRLARRAGHVVREHAELLATLERVVHDASTRRPDWDQVQRGFEHFVVRLREHETREDELIQEALEDDLGGGG